MSTTSKGKQEPEGGLRAELEHERLRAERAEQEVARLRSSNDLAVAKFALWHRVVDTLRWGVWIVALWVPLTALEPIARSFAGQDTKFAAALNISFIYSFGVSALCLATITQSRLRKKKIRGQRKRLDELERLLLEAQQDVREGGRT